MPENKSTRQPQDPNAARRVVQGSGLTVVTLLGAAGVAWASGSGSFLIRFAGVLVLVLPLLFLALVMTRAAERRAAEAVFLRQEVDAVRAEARVATELPKLAESDQPAAEVARVALARVGSVVNFQWGGLIISDADGVAIKQVFDGPVPPEFRYFLAGQPQRTRNFLGAITDSSEPVYLDGASTHLPDLWAFFEAGTRGLAFVPAGETASGGHLLLLIVRTGRAQPWTQRDRDLLELAGRTLTVSVERRARLQRLRGEALTDPLTDLGNRRSFEADLAAELSRATSQNHPVGVLSLDIDGLKVVNDSLGHAGGDGLLRAFAQALRAHFRDEDRVYRVGGDEFVAILPHLDPRAHSVALARVEAAVRDVRAQGYSRAGASAGVASYPQEAADGESLVHLSDQRMYAVKAHCHQNDPPDVQPPGSAALPARSVLLGAAQDQPVFGGAVTDSHDTTLGATPEEEQANEWETPISDPWNDEPLAVDEPSPSPKENALLEEAPLVEDGPDKRRG